jgi:glycosyltransferase involved in cell wall biosynthesis
MPKKPIIYIYGLSNVYYDSYYIKGLKEYFEVDQVHFNVTKFPKFGFYHAMSIIVKYEDREIKICIDSFDDDEIRKAELDWCDYYGKANFNKSKIPTENSCKVKAIGPGFGIKIWNLPQTIVIALINYFRFRKVIRVKERKLYLLNYLAQYKRLPLEDYFIPLKENQKKGNYIFFISSIWKKEFSTNSFRSNFIKSCLNIKTLNFEGGFAPRKDKYHFDFDEIIVEKRYEFKEYIKKTKQSYLVFNTPAVSNCHGWKLAEFFAIGKAIISTKFHNEMPIELIDGKDILFLKVGDVSEIKNKINFLFENPDLQIQLETNSKQYFLENLMPKKVFEKLFKNNKNQTINVQ